MRNGGDIGITRNRFEAFLRKRSAEARKNLSELKEQERQAKKKGDELAKETKELMNSLGVLADSSKRYIDIKKKAMEEGKDSIKELRKYVDKNLGAQRGMDFWFMAVGKRLVEAENEDVEFVRSAMASEGINFDAVVELLKDRKKAARVIRAFNIKKLKNAGYTSLYMIVDKLINTKGGNRPPISGRAIFEEIPDSIIEENVDAFELLKQYGIEMYQVMYDNDSKKTKKEIKRKMEEYKERPVQKALFKSVFDYFEELEKMEIPGIVREIMDAETGEMIHFPAIHQKIGARTIAEKKRLLLADDMGLGKTAQAVIAKNLIDKLEGRRTTAVAVVPPNLLMQWKDQIALWNTKKTVVIPPLSKGSRKAKAVAEIIEKRDDGTLHSVPIKSEEELAEIREKRSDYMVVVPVVSGRKEEALATIEKEKPDFVLVPYTMVYRKFNGGTIGDELKGVCDYLIPDEIHNAKKAEAKSKPAARSREVLKLSEGAKYVAMLSGTPMPNRIEDLGVIATILSNHQTTPKKFNQQYRLRPDVVEPYIASSMLRRTKEETSWKRRCTPEFIRVPMSPEQQVKHERIDINPHGYGALQLILELRKCALDPCLAGIDQDSLKYKKLIDMILSDMNAEKYDGTPAVVFSELKRDVLGKLCQQLSDCDLRVARIDGDPERSGRKRETILEDFKKGKYDVLVATRATMGEGVDALSISHRGYMITVPYTYDDIKQTVARLDRKGQKSDVVDFKILVSENSIDERLVKLTEQKKLLARFVIDGVELSDYEKKIIEERPENLVQSSRDPLRRLYAFFGETTNSRTEDIIRALNDPVISRFVTDTYWNYFEKSYYGNMNKLIADTIREIEGISGEFKDILDLASGPCCLARALERPVTSVDINEGALLLGKKMLGEKAGECIKASFTDLPFTEPTFDLVVFSLGLHHSATYEREGIMREINRSMKKDGTLIITLPSGEGKYEKLAAVLPMLGYKIIADMSGTGRDLTGKKFECVVFTAKKVGPPTVDSIPVHYFDYHVDKMRSENWASVLGKVKDKECDGFTIDEVPVGDAAKRAIKSARKKRATKTPKKPKRRKAWKQKETPVPETVQQPEEKQAEDAVPEQEAVVPETQSGETQTPAITSDSVGSKPLEEPAMATDKPPKQQEIPEKIQQPEEKPEVKAESTESKDDLSVPQGVMEDPVQYLLERYGGAPGVRKNCPQELLDKLGVELYEQGRRRSRLKLLGLRKKSNGGKQMQKDHKEFVQKRKRSRKKKKDSTIKVIRRRPV